jgi:hypothetical protein
MRARRVAQIVRDFMDGFVLARQVGAQLRDGVLVFTDVERLVGGDQSSLLYRLKEECHALFRQDQEQPSERRTEIHAEELFDLAVGALFHESMKFREGFYLTTTYGPRLQRMMAEGRVAGPLADVFWRVFDAGRRRMLESEAETASLFRETRDQLRILLRQMPESADVARSLVEDPQRTQEVFGVPLSELLREIYGSSDRGCVLAIESLIANGHFREIEPIVGLPEARGSADLASALVYARGMASYYEGDPETALDELADWVRKHDARVRSWESHAERVLRKIATNFDLGDDEIGRRALELATELNSRSS